MGDCIKQETDMLTPERKRNRDVVILSSGSELSGFSSDDEISDDDFSPSWRKNQTDEPILPLGFLDPLEKPLAVAPLKAIAMAVGAVKQEEDTVTDVAPLRSFSEFSGFGSYGEGSDVEFNPSRRKKQRTEPVLPIGFLDPIEKPMEVSPISVGPMNQSKAVTTVSLLRGSKQFWKAGDYEGSSNAGGGSEASLADMDHVRVHPRFLHSNATSHKWALGAFAELLDNALDEDCNGVTYVLVDVLDNSKDNNKMVVVQDDGGGMTPDKMRRCMSLGYSEKSKMANTIGQYGNGFKTSTMRLGADVIVFSRCRGKYGGRATQSIGLLSYTFLRSTRKEDIVVPMIDYERVGETWCKRAKLSPECLQRNLDTIVQWSPFETEEVLLKQFDFLSDQGTRIIIYNLWEDEQGLLELDFDTDPHDIQIRGANRDEKKIEMAKVYPSSRHFLTYRHSLRSYTSILYLMTPPGFRIILRGLDVEHHNMVNDMIHTKELVYKPIACADAIAKDPNMSATVTLGFIKDAAHHIDVQGFNVYHKNRLIKPFWRVWNAAGSDGRGVIGVLQANFMEPAHDKQGFERTTALTRLENRLVHFQKTYWSSQCQLVGYAQRRNLKKDSSSPCAKEKSNSKDHDNLKKDSSSPCAKEKSNSKDPDKTPNKPSSINASNNENEHRSPANEVAGRNLFESHVKTMKNSQPQSSFCVAAGNGPIKTEKNNGSACSHSSTDMVLMMKEENLSLRSSLNRVLQDLKHEKERNNSLQNQEENLRKRLQDASETIQGLLRRVKLLEASSGLRL